MYGTKIWLIWRNMLVRCTNPKSKDWENYGGRGIKVAERWHSLTNFHVDMGDPPPQTSLDRIDVDGPYAPGNCRWASRDAQALNTRVNRLITYHGEEKPLKVWTNELSLPYRGVHARLRRGWSVERAFEYPFEKSS